MNKLIILCGIPFSGKSTLAKEISKKLNYNRVDLDDVKFKLHGDNIKDEDLMQKDWDVVYQEMYKRIENSLKSGKTVVHDTGNFTKYERNLIKQIADKFNLDALTVFVDTPKEIAYRRLKENRESGKRFDVSGDGFESSVKEMETPGSDENTLVFRYNDNIDSWIENNL